jgi:competence protein ComEC
MKPRLSIFNNFPFLRFTIVFILGILIENRITSIPVYLPLSLFGLLLLLIVSSRFVNQSILKDRLFSVILLFTLLIAGFAYSQQYNNLQFHHTIPQDGIYSGIVYEKVPSTNNRFKYTVKLECGKDNNNFHFINERILLYSSDSLTNDKIEPGSEIFFRTHLFEIDNKKNPGEFDFKTYMLHKGIRYQASVKNGIVLSDTRKNTPLTLALNIRTRLMKLYHDAGINGDEYAVLGALTLGDQNYISNEVKSYFAASGAMHVLSVSGLHVGIIFVVLNILLKPLNKRKKLKGVKVILLLSFLWIYAFITGLSPSVLRSTSMFSFLVIGENFNQRTNTYNTLAVSAFLLLLINPLIIFDVGFQLSYMAVFSILFFQPKLASLVKPKNVIAKYAWDLLTVSIAAQLGTTPVSIYYFNQFPSYFLLSNFIVVPASALILYLGMLFFAVSFIPFLNHSIAFLLKYLTLGLNLSVKTIEELPGSVIQGITISLLAVVLLYLLIASLSSFLITKRSIHLLISLSTLALLLTLNNISEVRSLTQEKIIIYNDQKAPLISYIAGKNHYYYSPTDSIDRYSKEMLKCASEKYRTRRPVLMKEEKEIINSDRPKIVTIEGIPITIDENKFPVKRMLADNDIMYEFSKSIVRMNLSDDIKPEGINRDSILTSNNGINKVFKLKYCGALILNLK